MAGLGWVSLVTLMRREARLVDVTTTWCEMNHWLVVVVARQANVGVTGKKKQSKKEVSVRSTEVS